MAKQQGAKVDKLEFPKLGIEIEIRFVKGNGTFYGEYQGKTYGNHNILDLKTDLTDAVMTTTAIAWKPILMIKFLQNSDQDGGVGWTLNAKRFYAFINPKPQSDNRPWMSCAWDAPEDKRMGWARVDGGMFKAELPLVKKGSYGEKHSTIYMAYDNDLYQQLIIAIDGMRHFRDAMQKPLLSADNLPLLSITLQRFMSALQVMYPISDPPEKKDASEV